MGKSPLFTISHHQKYFNAEYYQMAFENVFPMTFNYSKYVIIVSLI